MPHLWVIADDLKTLKHEEAKRSEDWMFGGDTGAKVTASGVWQLRAPR